MCDVGPSKDGIYELTVTEEESERFKKAIADVLVGDQPDYHTLREIHIRLRRATRKVSTIPTQKVPL